MSTSIRYTLRHMLRGGGKTVLAILLALLLTAAVGRLDSLRQHYEALSRSVLVQGSVIGGITLYRAESLAGAEEVKDYYLEEVVKRVEALLLKHEDPLEDRPSDANITLVFTSDYSKVAGNEVEWLEGWDAEIFQAANSRVCLITRNLSEYMEVGLGDRFHLAENGYGYQIEMKNDVHDPREIIRIFKERRPATTIVGLVDVENQDDRLWLPIHAMHIYENDFPGIKVGYATYTLRDYRDIEPFRARFLEETSKQQGNPSLYLDTAEADRIRKMSNLLSTLYPIALGVALLLGAVLPGLMVLQSSRETSILRVLGMSRKRVCLMLTGEQLLLCLLGLILGVILTLALGAWEGALYPLVHLAACLVGSAVFAWVGTRQNVLALLQAKE